MASIWVYPGQGVQRSNMLHDLPQNALVKEYLERASDALKADVLMLDSPDCIAVDTCSTALFTDFRCGEFSFINSGKLNT